MRKILCYDLHGADSDDYQAVYDYIQNDLNGIRATESVFIFFSELENKELRDDFKTRFGPDVSVLINDFPLNAATYKIENNGKWLNRNS